MHEWQNLPNDDVFLYSCVELFLTFYSVFVSVDLLLLAANRFRLFSGDSWLNAVFTDLNDVVQQTLERSSTCKLVRICNCLLSPSAGTFGDCKERHH